MSVWKQIYSLILLLCDLWLCWASIRRVPERQNYFLVFMRFVIPAVFYEITNVECMYSSNTTILYSTRLTQLYNIVVLDEYTHSTLVISRLVFVVELITVLHSS